MCAHITIRRALGMPKYPRDDVHAFFVSQYTARHGTADEFLIVHKKVPYAEANIVGEYSSFVKRQGFETLSSALGCGPPVQRRKEDALAAEI